MQKARFPEFSTPCAAFVPPPASRRPRQAHSLLGCGGQNLTSEADQYATSGEALAQGDALIAAGRSQQLSAPLRRGFDIGIAVTGTDTVWVRANSESSTPSAGRTGRIQSSGFLCPGSESERTVGCNRRSYCCRRSDCGAGDAQRAGLPNWLGFDIASGVFGDPALGALGNKATGPGSERIRNGLSAPAQRGYNASTQLHLSRSY